MKKFFQLFIFIVIFLIGIGISFFLWPFKPSLEESSKEVNETNLDNLITTILSYDLKANIDADFLNWVRQNYGEESLTKILTDLENKTYSLESFYQATNNSFIVLNDYFHELIGDNVKVINNSQKEITLSFIGDVSLADNYQIMPKYIERNQGIYGILNENVVNILKNADVLVANNEFTVSQRGQALAGKAFTFRANPENLTIYEEMGVDLVTLANNHVYDYGLDAFTDMLISLDTYNIPHIGAGKNLEEASKPYYFIVNGRKIAFVNATRAEKNIMTPGATIDQAGVLRCYDPTNFLKVIKEAKDHSDYVIALIHWGKENYHTLEDVQKETSKMYLEAGADVIVGTHAHVLQGMEFYQDKLIAYNLGDFIFSSKTKDTGILNIKIDSQGQMHYNFAACLEKDEYTQLLEGTEKLKVLKDLESYSVNAKFLANGEIVPK